MKLILNYFMHVFILIFITFANANATNGVLEINQVCATTPSGCFNGDTIDGFPVVINGTAGSSYRLTSDLILPDADATGIFVINTSATIDLNGFSIIRQSCVNTDNICTLESGIGSGIFVNGTAVIKNGAIKGMGVSGISVNGEQSSVSGVSVSWNAKHGIEAFRGTIIKGNTAYENGEHGIRARHNSQIQNNTSYKNGSDGIHISGAGSSIFNNISNENLGDGIETTGRCSVNNNTSILNIGFGLKLSLLTAYRENTIISNSGGTVLSGYNMENNFCNSDNTCP